MNPSNATETSVHVIEKKLIPLTPAQILAIQREAQDRLARQRDEHAPKDAWSMDVHTGQYQQVQASGHSGSSVRPSGSSGRPSGALAAYKPVLEIDEGADDIGYNIRTSGPTNNFVGNVMCDTAVSLVQAELSTDPTRPRKVTLPGESEEEEEDDYEKLLEEVRVGSFSRPAGPPAARQGPTDSAPVGPVAGLPMLPPHLRKPGVGAAAGTGSEATAFSGALPLPPAATSGTATDEHVIGPINSAKSLRDEYLELGSTSNSGRMDSLGSNSGNPEILALSRQATLKVHEDLAAALRNGDTKSARQLLRRLETQDFNTVLDLGE